METYNNAVGCSNERGKRRGVIIVFLCCDSWHDREKYDILHGNCIIRSKKKNRTYQSCFREKIFNWDEC